VDGAALAAKEMIKAASSGGAAPFGFSALVLCVNALIILGN
jgi:hypothetical protein